MTKKRENIVDNVVNYMNLAQANGIETFYMKNGDFVLEFRCQQFAFR
jgi:hypothetical protein